MSGREGTFRRTCKCCSALLSMRLEAGRTSPRSRGRGGTEKLDAFFPADSRFRVAVCHH